jgi:hypothetical protein
MPAVVRVTSHHTAGDDASTAEVAGTTIYFKTADSDASGGNVVHNAGGTNYSWIKQLKLYVLTAPAVAITNLKFYWSTPTPPTNIDVKVKANSGAYIDPTVQAATALTGVASAYSYTSLAPLSLNGSFVVGTDTAPKFIGDWIVLQLAAGNAAIASNVVLGSGILRWDEQ